MQNAFTFLLIILVIFSSCHNKDSKQLSENTQIVQNVVWYSVDSAKFVFETDSSAVYPKYETACRTLLYSYINLKLHRNISVDELISVRNYFHGQKDELMEGEATYVLGLAYEQLGDKNKAALELKKAELLLLTTKSDVPPILFGMVCYRLGMIFENDWLYKDANDYYLKALPYLQQTNNHIYVACILRDIARTTKDADFANGEVEIRQLRDSLFSLALEEASLSGDTAIYLDVLDYAISFGSMQDTAEILKITRYMTNVLRQPRYAGQLAEYYLSVGKVDSAQLCLDFYALDTATQVWSRDKWHYLHSKLLIKQGRSIEAYNVLENLYKIYMHRMLKDGQAKTYAITKQYDILKEQERNLQLTIRQQKLYIALALAFASIVLVCLIGLLYRQYSKRQANRQQEKISMLDAELQSKREVLRRMLSERVELTRKMQLSEIMQGRKKDELPQWAQTFIEQSLLTSQQQWDEFLVEFNAASNNLLDRLKNEHPLLTRTDLLISALIMIDLSIQDICVLLNQAKRTIWSRRLRIKKHLGLSDDDNLDDWLYEQLKLN